MKISFTSFFKLKKSGNYEVNNIDSLSSKAMTVQVSKHPIIRQIASKSTNVSDFSFISRQHVWDLVWHRLWLSRDNNAAVVARRR
jgi:hypothetical protein